MIARAAGRWCCCEKVCAFRQVQGSNTFCCCVSRVLFVQQRRRGGSAKMCFSQEMSLFFSVVGLAVRHCCSAAQCCGGRRLLLAGRVLAISVVHRLRTGHRCSFPHSVVHGFVNPGRRVRARQGQQRALHHWRALLCADGDPPGISVYLDRPMPPLDQSGS